MRNSTLIALGLASGATFFGLAAWRVTHFPFTDPAAPAPREAGSPPTPREAPVSPPNPDAGAATSSLPSPEALRDPDGASGAPSERPETGASGVSLAHANLWALGEDYEPTRERFLLLAGALERALEMTPEDLADLPEGFWEAQENRYWVWLATALFQTLQDALGGGLDPKGQLEALWGVEGVQGLWSVHAALEWSRANASRGGLTERVALADSRLDQTREAIWREAGEVYALLWRIERASR